MSTHTVGPCDATVSKNRHRCVVRKIVVMCAESNCQKIAKVIIIHLSKCHDIVSLISFNVDSASTVSVSQILMQCNSTNLQGLLHTEIQCTEHQSIQAFISHSQHVILNYLFSFAIQPLSSFIDLVQLNTVNTNQASHPKSKSSTIIDAAGGYIHEPKCTYVTPIQSILVPYD